MDPAYIVHDVLRDTDDQLQMRYRVGKFRIPPVIFHLMVWLLILGEIGGLGFVHWRADHVAQVNAREACPWRLRSDAHRASRTARAYGARDTENKSAVAL